MKKILINAANLNKGGGIQVATSLILNFAQQTDYSFCFVISEQIEKEINRQYLGDDSVIVYEPRGSKGLKRQLGIRKLLVAMEKKFNPIAVVTVFGPVLWRPNAIHLCGYARAHNLYEFESSFFHNISYYKRLYYKLFKWSHFAALTYSSKFFYTETEDASLKLSEMINRPVFTIHNALNDKLLVERETKTTHQIVPKILIVSADYPHKNLAIISEVDAILSDLNLNIEFHFTLESDPAWLDDIRNARNHGKVMLEDLSGLYSSCDALLLPTLLECFTASYLEASYFGLPILTSDYSFARTICKNDAIYFDPMNPNEIAEKIVLLFESQEGYQSQSKSSSKIHLRYPSAKMRAEKVLEKIEDILSGYGANAMECQDL